MATMLGNQRCHGNHFVPH